jgi:hypothetical protein
VASASATLVLPDTIANAMRAALEESRETGGVLLVGLAESPDGTLRVLGRELHLLGEGAYLRRERGELVVGSDAWAPALARAAQIGAAAMWFHTHPGASGRPFRSRRDERVDELLAEPFRIRTGVEVYGSAIIAGEPQRARFAARVSEGTAWREISRVWEVSDRLRLTQAVEPDEAQTSLELFDRNVRAFGGGVQRTVSALSIGVVGAGGTGSAVAEQLMRLGVRKLTIVDPDTLSRSNLTRVYGSTPADIGQPKAAVLAAHLARIAPDAKMVPVQGSIVEEDVARRLIGCDLVFGCTDDNAGRLILSRLSSYLLTPVIDCGVLLSSTANGELRGIDGRVTTLIPGAACLVCRKRVDLERARAELAPAEEHARLAREGYAPALGRVEPAVVAYTTAVAAAAVGELIERLTAFGPEPVPNEVLLRLHERELSANRAEPRPGHYCDPAAGKLGRGAADPFLEQTWAR